GNPEAADWILAAWQRDHQIDLVGPLVELGRQARSENVRAAMRAIADDNKFGRTSDRSILLLALLSMHDEPALDLVAKLVNVTPAVRHPYATKEPHPSSPGVTPLQYLVYENPDPPHGFTEEDVLGVLQRIAAKGLPPIWQPASWSLGAIPDRLLGEMARLAIEGNLHRPDQGQVRSDWASVALSRARVAAGRGGPLRDWAAQMLQHEQPRARTIVIQHLEPDEVGRERSLIEKCLDTDDESCALVAARALLRCEPPLEAARLLQNKHVRVRIEILERIPALLGPAGDTLVLPLTKDIDSQVRNAAAIRLGALVSKEAVPALIELLQDKNGDVRTSAADALTRIRFYHEQQAHWDRVLKGLDASPASAAEKLLLQAKPGAAKPQRLLAIESLGILGVPEALPFLIEWTQDPDADIATKAKAAVTAIHLNPRR
ncbi:MAG: HEAT repeat domain-containing protein, partial [Planctomycetota bacterium]